MCVFLGDFCVCNKSGKLFVTNSISISFPVSRTEGIFLQGTAFAGGREHVDISILLLLMSRTSVFLGNFRQIQCYFLLV